MACQDNDIKIVHIDLDDTIMGHTVKNHLNAVFGLNATNRINSSDENSYLHYSRQNFTAKQKELLTCNIEDKPLVKLLLGVFKKYNIMVAFNTINSHQVGSFIAKQFPGDVKYIYAFNGYKNLDTGEIKDINVINTIDYGSDKIIGKLKAMKESCKEFDISNGNPAGTTQLKHIAFYDDSLNDTSIEKIFTDQGIRCYMYSKNYKGVQLSRNNPDFAKCLGLEPIPSVAIDNNDE